MRSPERLALISPPSESNACEGVIGDFSEPLIVEFG